MRLALNAYFWNRPDTGSGQYLVNLARQLTAQEPGWEFTLVYPQYGPDTKPAAGLLPETCHWVPVPARPGHLGKVAFEQAGFPRACRQIDADLAHVPYWGSPLRAPVPTIVTVHDLIPLLLREYRGGLLARLYTGLVAAAARGAAHVITDSFASKADVETHLHIPADRITAIHLAANDHFRPGPPDPAVVARYNLPDQYVMYLGGMDVRKNLANLLHAYAYAGPAIGDQFQLVLAGRVPSTPSPRFPNLAAVIQALELERFVHQTGFVEEGDKPALYRGAAVVAQISRYEGFGLTALEAMACGTPVVASNRSSLPEVVGSAGFTLDPDDVEGIAGAIIACAIQEELREELRLRGLEQASRFSWQRAAAQTIQAYHQALRHPFSLAQSHLD